MAWPCDVSLSTCRPDNYEVKHWSLATISKWPEHHVKRYLIFKSKILLKQKI